MLHINVYTLAHLEYLQQCLANLEAPLHPIGRLMITKVDI